MQNISLSTLNNPFFLIVEGSFFDVFQGTFNDLELKDLTSLAKTCKTFHNSKRLTQLIQLKIRRRYHFTPKLFKDGEIYPSLFKVHGTPVRLSSIIFGAIKTEEDGLFIANLMKKVYNLEYGDCLKIRY